MREEISAGGVVTNTQGILLLRKYSGDWVLPKGKVEEGETPEIAAIREVHEESGILGELIKYLGEMHYTYNENWDLDRQVHKKVFWYLMSMKSGAIRPLRDEGFVEGRFVPFQRSITLIKYNDEREIVKVALKEILPTKGKQIGQ